MKLPRLSGPRTLVAAFAAAVAMVGAVPVYAGITIDSPCAGQWTWNASTSTLSCVTSSTNTNPLGSCTWGQVATKTAGDTATLTIACSNGPPTNPATFAWTVSPATGCTNCSATLGQATTDNGSNTLKGVTAGTFNVSVSVTATNGNGTGSASGQVTFQAASDGTGNNTSGPYNCGSTFSSTRTLTLPAWSIGATANTHLYTADAGHFGPNDAVVVEITAPSWLGSDRFGSLSWSDIGADPPAKRVVVLSDTACDFTKGVGGNALAIVSGAANASLYFSAGANSVGYPALTVPGRKYFLNIMNKDCVSSTGHCDLDIEFMTPK
jgi:hypothetical protein